MVHLPFIYSLTSYPPASPTISPFKCFCICWLKCFQHPRILSKTRNGTYTTRVEDLPGKTRNASYQRNIVVKVKREINLVNCEFLSCSDVLSILNSCNIPASSDYLHSTNCLQHFLVGYIPRASGKSFARYVYMYLVSIYNELNCLM